VKVNPHEKIRFWDGWRKPKDSLKFLSDPSAGSSVVQVKVGPNRDHQMQDTKDGVTISPYKTRAELPSSVFHSLHAQNRLGPLAAERQGSFGF
jgi:hypothetical protein